MRGITSDLIIRFGYQNIEPIHVQGAHGGFSAFVITARLSVFTEIISFSENDWKIIIKSETEPKFGPATVTFFKLFFCI